MASIPCAAYKATSIHGNMRRRSRTTSTSSVDSVECDSLSSSPSQAGSAPVSGGGMSMMQMLRKTTGWTDAGRSKSQADMRFVSTVSGVLQNVRFYLPSPLEQPAENRWIVHTLDVFFLHYVSLPQKWAHRRTPHVIQKPPLKSARLNHSMPCQQPSHPMQ